MVDVAVITVLDAAFLGLLLSVGLEQFLLPHPSLIRPHHSWALHAGLWLVPYGILVFLLGRPWFAASIVSAFLLMLVLVNNAKVKSLREPFVFQDYEYFIDMIKHPRLYIPFMGWWKFLAAAAGFILALCIGLWGESVPAQRFTLTGQAGGVAVVVLVGVALLIVGNREKQHVSFDPDRDISVLGFLPSLWRYAQEEQRFPEVIAPADCWVPCTGNPVLPHLVAVQSESFFDPRPLYSGIKSNVLLEFDLLKENARGHGRLTVPAWGANTVRSEFAFLSAIAEDELGVHRFNPYRPLAAGWQLRSLASFLQSQGYRTVCIHPYPASFYKRQCVYPAFGFDEFIDITSFDKTMRFGPYTGDVAVAQKVADILQLAVKPLFVFVITMENHGPLHLEQVQPEDIDRFYSSPPPTGCDDLTIYLRHLQNADRMISDLRATVENSSASVSLCWFGDHVPIMPTVYSTFGPPHGEVEYCIYDNGRSGVREIIDLSAHELSRQWLRLAKVID